MLRAIQITLAVITLASFSVVAQADSVTWDVLNEDYGSGSGQVAVSNSYTLGAWGTAAPNEVDSDGNAQLTLASGDHTYLTRASFPGMVTGNADYTMEFKVTTPTKSQFMVQWSETNSTATTDWNHTFLINGTFAGPQTDALQDYNWGRPTANQTVSQAPSGFDGSAAHIYRFVRQSGTEQLYLDNGLTPVLALGDGAGSAADHLAMELGLAEAVGATSAEVNFSYLRIASGAHVPSQTPEPSTLALLVTGIVGSLIAYGWRKRR